MGKNRSTAIFCSWVQRAHQFHCLLRSNPSWSSQDFWKESFSEVDPIVMEDNAPVHKKVWIPVRDNLGMECWEHHPNSLDLNSIENVWHHIKHICATEYENIMFQSQLQDIVNNI